MIHDMARDIERGNIGDQRVAAAAWWVLGAYAVGGTAVASIAAWWRERGGTAVSAVGSDGNVPEPAPAG